MIPTFKLGALFGPRVHSTIADRQTNSVPDMCSLFLFITKNNKTPTTL